MSSTNDPKSTRSPEPNLRREARVDACIKVAIVRGRRVVPLETSDVSFKGLFLRTDEPPPVRSLLRLRVAIPLRPENGRAETGTFEIEAHAMAVHVATPGAEAEAGVGLQFWGLAGRDRVLWDDFVRELIQSRRVATKLAESGERLAGVPTPSGVHTAPSFDRDRASGDD